LRKARGRINTQAEIRYGRSPPPGLAEPELLHEAAHVIMIVAHPKAGFDNGGQTRRGPAVVGKSVNARALRENVGNELQLLPAQAAGPAGRPPFPQGLPTFLLQGPIPPRSRGAANAEF